MGLSTLPVVVCLGMLLLSAQTPAPKPAATSAEPSTPVLKVTTHLVEINVVVHGRKNELVDDLKREDFTIFDK